MRSSPTGWASRSNTSWKSSTPGPRRKRRRIRLKKTMKAKATAQQSLRQTRPQRVAGPRPTAVRRASPPSAAARVRSSWSTPGHARSCGRYTRSPSAARLTNWILPPGAWSTGSSGLWPASSPPFFPQHFAVSLLQSGSHGRHIPVSLHFGARAGGHSTGALRAVQNFQHFICKLPGIVGQRAELAVNSRQTLRANPRRNHRNAARERFEQLYAYARAAKDGTDKHGAALELGPDVFHKS